MKHADFYRECGKLMDGKVNIPSEGICRNLSVDAYALYLCAVESLGYRRGFPIGTDRLLTCNAASDDVLAAIWQYDYLPGKWRGSQLELRRELLEKVRMYYFSHYLVTGIDVRGKQWRRETNSAFLASGLNAYYGKRIWRVFKDGSRLLCK